MSDEISVTTRLKVIKDYLSLDKNAIVQVDFTGSHYSQAAQVIGSTAAELLEVSDDVTTYGFAFFRNLDSSNLIQIGIDSGGFVPVLQLYAGECAVMRVATLDLYALTIDLDPTSGEPAATAVLEWLVIED